jgi:hypothetical protein
MGRVYSNKNILLKTVSIISFIFITVALVLIERNSPATGYELSIYSALPSSVWVLLLIAISCGIFVIVHQAFSKDKGNFWLMGFLILILATFIILSLPFIRNYYLLCGDVEGHLGYISDLVASGHFDEENSYPITHILGGETAEICGISPRIATLYLPVIFTILFMIFTFFFASSIGFRGGHKFIALAASGTLLYGYYHVEAYPQALSIFAFPLFFYLYFLDKVNSSFPLKILIIILLLLFPFFHPASETVLILCLFGGEFTKLIWDWHQGRNYTNTSKGKISLNPALISFITFFIWFSSFAAFSDNVGRFFSWFRGEVTEIPRTIELEPVMKLELWERIELYFKMYGAQTTFLALTAIAFILIFISFLKRKREYKRLFILSALLLISMFTYFLIFLSIEATTWGRLIAANPTFWAMPALAGFTLYEAFNKWKFKNLGIILIVTILTLSSSLSIFSLYRSPWILQPNWQITYSDNSGAGWCSIYTDSKMPTVSLGWGVLARRSAGIPTHFGYAQHQNLGELSNEDFYLIITQRFKSAALDQRLGKKAIYDPELVGKEFTKEDFQRLKQDSSLSSVYSNGEFESFMVKALKTQPG